MIITEIIQIILRLQEYVIKYFVWWRNGTLELIPFHKDKNLFESTFSGFFLDNFFKCYGMKIPPDGNIQQFGALMKNEIFPNSIRPHSVAFFTLFHYPNQLVRSVRSIHYMWQKITSNNTYEMIFKINKMEMIRRRNKSTRPCHDSENHDDRVLVQHISKVGCRPPYLKPSKWIRPCATKEEMKNVRFLLRTDEYDNIPPCRSMEKISYTYLESDMSGTKYEGVGEFWISSAFYDQYFQEIIKTR